MLSSNFRRVKALPVRCNISSYYPTKRFFSKMANLISANVNNPLLGDWSKFEFGLPPFAACKPSHYEDALKISAHLQIEELKAIVNNPEAPTFENTIATFDRSGCLFAQVSNLFDNLCSSNGVPELQAVELKMAGPLAAHQNNISSLPGLFARIETVHDQRASLNLTAEQNRLVERFYLDFVRAGASPHCVCIYCNALFLSAPFLCAVNFS
jgi:peptidyl-dipeptidase Dcp